jgi:hypothetical protein
MVVPAVRALRRLSPAHAVQTRLAVALAAVGAGGGRSPRVLRVAGGRGPMGPVVLRTTHTAWPAQRHGGSPGAAVGARLPSPLNRLGSGSGGQVTSTSRSPRSPLAIPDPTRRGVWGAWLDLVFPVVTLKFTREWGHASQPPGPSACGWMLWHGLFARTRIRWAGPRWEPATSARGLLTLLGIRIATLPAAPRSATLPITPRMYPSDVPLGCTRMHTDALVAALARRTLGSAHPRSTSAPTAAVG